MYLKRIEKRLFSIENALCQLFYYLKHIVVTFRFCFIILKERKFMFLIQAISCCSHKSSLYNSKYLRKSLLTAKLASYNVIEIRLKGRAHGYFLII